MSIKKLLEFDFCSTLFLWNKSDACGKNRLIIVICSFALGFSFLAYRMISLASNPDIEIHYLRAQNNYFRKEIVDRNNKLLAVNIPTASLFANPKKVIDAANAVKLLRDLFPDIDKNTLLAELRTNKSFIWVKRDLTPRQEQQIQNLGLVGFDFEKEYKRTYPYGRLFSHVVGYVSRDLVGLAGLERAYDKFLTDKDQDKDKPLKLSIDARLQNILSEEMQVVIDKFGAIGGVGIIVNPKTGEVLALVSKKDFDPHNPGLAAPEQLFNKASLGVAEVGSVFKAITIAISLDTNKVALGDAYDITNMQVGRFAVKDYHPRKGYHSVAEIFLHSSNIGVGQMMLEVGDADFKKYLKSLGLLDQLQIELPERANPLYPAINSSWSDLSLVTMSYGYGLSISPLHFVGAMIPIVNGGIAYPLTLIKQENDKPIIGARIFKETTSAQMRKLMRLVVAQGTGKKAEVSGYLVGGKTGTANKACKRGYSKDKRVSSFLGIIPASDPEYLIYIMFDEPKGLKETFGFATAGWTAAPAVGRVLARLAALYGLQPVDPEDTLVQEISDIQYKIQNSNEV
jgi:cell division protein FtsI (penicillin-binding protein 3)